MRGLNNPSSIVKVRKYLGHNKVNFVGLLETKVKISNKERVRRKFGGNWRWEDNYNASHRGRIWVAWNPTAVNF